MVAYPVAEEPDIPVRTVLPMGKFLELQVFENLSPRSPEQGADVDWFPEGSHPQKTAPPGTPEQVKKDGLRLIVTV